VGVTVVVAVESVLVAWAWAELALQVPSTSAKPAASQHFLGQWVVANECFIPGKITPAAVLRPRRHAA
jgi:hypothetical protein